jgi:alpha-methylacyl-CoA racemase
VDERDSNLTDDGAPFYRCYETSDGRYVAVGAIERKFYAERIDGLGLDPSLVESQMDTTQYPAMHQLFADTFATRTRDEWAEIFATRDACLTPALTMPEAPHHPHNVARGSFLSVAGSTQVAPPVRFGRTPACVGSPAPDPGAANDDVLRWLGLGRRRDRPAPSDTRRRVIASHQR